MPRSLTATQRYDLEFESANLGLMIFRPDREKREILFSPGIAQVGEVSPRKDVPYQLRDFSSGAGYGYPVEGSENGYGWGINFDGRWPGVGMPGPAVTDVAIPANSGPFVASFELDGNLWFVGGRYAVKLTGGQEPATSDQDLGASFNAESAALFHGTAFVGGTGGNIWRRQPLGSFSQAGGSIVRRHLATVNWEIDGIAAERLLGTDVNATAYQRVVNDPFTSGDWSPSTAIPLGNKSFPARGWAVTPRHAYVATTGGLLDLDEFGRAPNLIPHAERQAHTDNGRAVAIIDGYVYYGGGPRGLERVDVTRGTREDVTQYCHFGWGLPDESPIYGPATALVDDQGWLVASYFNGVDSHICWGADRAAINRAGVGPLLWHGAVITQLDRRVTHLKISSLHAGGPRLWIAWVDGDGVEGLSWAPLAVGGSPLQDYLRAGDYRFASSCQVFTPWQSWGSHSSRKTTLVYEVVGQNLGIASWGIWSEPDHQAAIFQARAASSPRSRIAPKEDSIQAHEFRYRLDGSGTPTNPPFLRAFTARASVKPELRPTRTYQVIVSEGMDTRTGTREDLGTLTIWDRLQGIQDGPPLYMRDENEEHLLVNIEQIIPSQELSDRAARPNERIAEMTITILERRGRPMRWDSGDKWDSGLVWG